MARSNLLQAGRGVAAVSVVAYHSSYAICEDRRFWGVAPFGHFFDFGHAGVYFFFVLSGFVIASAHFVEFGQPALILNYIRRRFIRLYPMYWLVTIPIVIIYFLFPTSSKPELASHSVIENSFILIGPNNHASLAVAWTLFHEVAFYIMFAAGFFGKRFGIATLVTWFASCVVTSLMIPLSQIFYFFSPFNLLFALGLICYWLTRIFDQRNPTFLIALGTLAFICTGCFEVYGPPTSTLTLVALFGISSALIVYGSACCEATRPLKINRYIILLGDASYAIYLVHFPLLSIAARVLVKAFTKEPIAVDLAFICLISVSVMVGILVHILLEKKILKVLNKMTARYTTFRVVA